MNFRTFLLNELRDFTIKDRKNISSEQFNISVEIDDFEVTITFEKTIPYGILMNATGSEKLYSVGFYISKDKGIQQKPDFVKMTGKGRVRDLMTIIFKTVYETLKNEGDRDTLIFFSGSNDKRTIFYKKFLESKNIRYTLSNEIFGESYTIVEVFRLRNLK